MSQNKTVKDLLYLPVLNWAKSLIQTQNTVIVGINGPQGCGKSTLCENLVDLATLTGLKAATLSIDDFYLTHSEQVTIAEKYKSNLYLQQRGYPGTHDLDLSSGILQSIKKLKTTGSVLCPQYDKSAYQGLGDRFPMSHWKKIDAPLDILFFEGWMLGFTPVPEKQLSDQNLKQINAILESYRVWNEVLDGFVHLSPSKISNVLNWRVEAEEKRKEQGFSGMSKNDVESYTRKFIPAYKTYLPNLTKSLGGYKNSLSFTIGENRLPVK